MTRLGRCQWCKKSIDWTPDPKQNMPVAYDSADKIYHLPCYDDLQAVARATGGTP